MLPFIRLPFKSHLVILLCVSCSPSTTVYYQLVETKSNVPTDSNSKYQVENNAIAINFRLWANYGNTGFTITNKTDQHLFINMKMSHRIVNGLALTYYQGRTSSSSASAGLAVKSVNNDIVAAVAENESVSFNEMEIITIPPKASKYINDGSVLFSDSYSFCELDNYPRGKDKSSIRFTKEESPMHLRYFISYKIGQQSTTYESIEHSYWVSGLSNFRSYQFVGTRDADDCDGDTRKVSFYKWYSPSRFYVRYTY